MGTEKKKWVAPNLRVAEALKERVAGLKPGDSLGTEVAIAAEFAVSRMTARKAVESLVAGGLVERRAGVGVFVCEGMKGPLRFRFLAGNLLWDSTIRVASAFCRVAAAAGAEVELRDAEGDAAKLKSELSELPSSGVSGAVVFSIHDAELTKTIVELASKGFPLVVVDEAFEASTDVVGVVSDNALGGRLAAERLIHAGHRELAFIGDYQADTVRARWAGFRQIAEQKGLKPVRMELKADDRLGDWTHVIHEATRRLLKRKTRPTGVFCSCDAVARHAMRAFTEVGISVPDDMSLVGFDDDPIAEWTTPALTTVRQDFSAMGREAVKALIARIAKPSAPGATVAVPVEFVARESLARRRN